jgi:hypothetical protein
VRDHEDSQTQAKNEGGQVERKVGVFYANDLHPAKVGFNKKLDGKCVYARPIGLIFYPHKVHNLIRLLAGLIILEHLVF